MGNIADWSISRIIYSTSFLIIALYVLCIPAVACAQSEEEMKVLQMYFKEEELVVTPTRSLTPASRVAANISVVTSDDIKKMNAHTLTDILNSVPGVQVSIRGGVGSESTAVIQGSEFRHVLVMIDGVSLNNLGDSAVDIGSIPVQHIERIEIIKGPASSAWGSSLGGVINIITKAPDDSRPFGGMLAASLGEQMTGDTRFELSGGASDFGYYLNAGNLSSNGLRPGTKFDENHTYTKLTWNAAGKTNAEFTFGYDKGSRGRGENPAYDMRSENDFEMYTSTLGLHHSINDSADINLSLRTSRQDTKFFIKEISTGNELDMNSFDEKSKGASIGFTWRDDTHSVVGGADYDNGELESASVTDGFKRLEKWAVFANDTITVHELSVTPGIRYDNTNTNGDFISPSLGVAYQATDRTVLRGYAARGFNIPPLSNTFATGFYSMPNPELDVEEVWSFQAGLESSALEYFHFKTNFFRHNIYDAIVNEEQPDSRVKAVNKDKQRRQGVEIEVRTAPVYNTTLFTGFVFIDAKNRSEDERLANTPRYTYDIGIQYSDDNEFSALVKGHYIWWYSESSFDADYDAFIWDAHLTKRIFNRDHSSAELFFSAHNIFNSSQYSLGLFKNPGRWIEGGVRLNF